MPPSLPQQLLPRCSARPWCPSEGLRPEPKPEQREGPAAPLPVLTAEKLPAECSHLTALPESRPSSASEKPIASSLGESYRVQGLKSAHSWPVEQAEWGQHTHVQQTKSPGAPISSPSLAESRDPFPLAWGPPSRSQQSPCWHQALEGTGLLSSRTSRGPLRDSLSGVSPSSAPRDD